MLPDGRRLHLQDGPIDLIVSADGDGDAPAAAFAAARARFASVLDELCAELPGLRRPIDPAAPCALAGSIARRMDGAVRTLAGYGFITPMAAVAGAVAEAVLAAMTAATKLRRAAVNNGGDIALHLGPGASLRIGMIARPDGLAEGLFGRVAVTAGDAVRGVATSGRLGRSFSLGIADAVTVLAAAAADADAAATVIANAVDLPGHQAVHRVPARSVQADSDLGDIFVTRGLGALEADEIAVALRRGLRVAEELAACGLIAGAALHLRGHTVTTPAFHQAPCQTDR